MNASTEEQLATLGGGCFWCLEPVFEALAGVENAVVGYAGGSVPNPSYQQVTAGGTGHAEVVQISFDAKVVSFEEILRVFFSMHDPTTLNRQGPDVGSQYRSIILYHDEEQKRTAEKVMAEIVAEGLWDGSIVTELVPYDAFYEAEDYHQEYFKKNPNAAYCRVWIAPKMAKFREKYREKLEESQPAAD